MKKAIIAAVYVLLAFLLSILFKVDPLRTLIIMIAYFVILDRLERDNDNEEDD